MFKFDRKVKNRERKKKGPVWILIYLCLGGFIGTFIGGFIGGYVGGIVGGDAGAYAKDYIRNEIYPIKTDEEKEQEQSKKHKEE